MGKAAAISLGARSMKPSITAPTAARSLSRRWPHLPRRRISTSLTMALEMSVKPVRLSSSAATSKLGWRGGMDGHAAVFHAGEQDVADQTHVGRGDQRVLGLVGDQQRQLQRFPGLGQARHRHDRQHRARRRAAFAPRGRRCARRLHKSSSVSTGAGLGSICWISTIAGPAHNSSAMSSASPTTRSPFSAARAPLGFARAPCASAWPATGQNLLAHSSASSMLVSQHQRLDLFAIGFGLGGKHASRRANATPATTLERAMRPFCFSLRAPSTRRSSNGRQNRRSGVGVRCVRSDLRRMGRRPSRIDLVRQAGAVGQPVDFHRLGQTRGHVPGKLPRKICSNSGLCQASACAISRPKHTARGETSDLFLTGHCRNFAKPINRSPAGRGPPKARPAAFFQLQPAAVKLGDVAHDGQPQPRAGHAFVQPFAALAAPGRGPRPPGPARRPPPAARRRAPLRPARPSPRRASAPICRHCPSDCPPSPPDPGARRGKREIGGTSRRAMSMPRAVVDALQHARQILEHRGAPACGCPARRARPRRAPASDNDRPGGA